MLIETMNAYVTHAMLATLPEPVQRYLAYTGIVGKPWIDTVRLKYSGAFRLAKDKPWMSVYAEQIYTTNPPGFQWRAWFKLFGMPIMSAQDTYKAGQAHMFGILAGLFTVFDARGPELLQGAMLRYLQEMMWFPTAYLSDAISWRGVDDHAVDVTFSDGAEQVTGRLYFDDAGRLISFVADRYRENAGSFTLDRWTTPITEYGTIAGLKLPIGGWGVWQLPDGDLPYIKIRVTDLSYNVPIPTF